MATCHVISASEKGFDVNMAFEDGGAETDVVADGARASVIVAGRFHEARVERETLPGC